MIASAIAAVRKGNLAQSSHRAACAANGTQGCRGRLRSRGAFGRGFAGQHFAGTRGHFDHDRGFGRRLGFEPGYYDYGCYSYPYYDPYSCYTPGY